MVALPSPDITAGAIRPSTEPLNYPRYMGRPGASSDEAAQLGAEFQQQGAQEADANDQVQYAQARSAFLTAKVNTVAALQDDPNWQTAPQRYTQAMTPAQ